MKKTILGLLLLTISINGFSQQKEPVMSFKKTLHDFGTIRQEDGIAKVTFEYTNTGSAPLIITEVNSSCGCTTPSYSKQPIPPGGKGYIDAAYDPLNSPGQFSKTITVKSNSNNSPIVLTIRGTVAEKGNFIEEKYPQVFENIRLSTIFLNFGNVYNNEKKEQKIFVYNPTNEPITIDMDAGYSSKFLTIKSEPQTLKSKQEGKIIVTLDGSLVNDWDFIRGNIFLKINQKTITKKPISVSAIIKEYYSAEQLKNAPKIVFDETSYSFDTINEGVVVEKVFKFKNEGKSDLIIRKTSTSCGCTAVNMTNTPIAPGKTGEIKVIFNTDHKPNNQIKTVSVVTNIPEPNNKVILKISGYVKPKTN